MEYDPSDSSGTADDLLPSHQTRSARGGQLTGNGRTIVGGFPYTRVQNDMENQIHQLEQEAYIAVLRAFKAQSDAITWEKESLITELRKELRVPDDEHRDLLSRVNADEVIRQIREWRQCCGLQSSFLNNAQPNHDMVPSPTVSASRKRQKTSQAVPALPLGVPSSSLHPQSLGVPLQASSSAAKRGTPGVRGKKAKLGQPLPVTYTHTGPGARGQAASRIAPGAVVATGHSVVASQYFSLIGRRVMTRWPDDNNFYEAIIRDYDAAKGLHLLSYDMNTPNESWEWVNLEEISPEDIRWEGEDLSITHRGGRGGSGRGLKKSGSRGGAALVSGRGRGFLKNQLRKDFAPTQNGTKRNMDEIEILNTDILIKEVEKVFNEAHPDPTEVEKAKKVLKEHEQSLLDAITRLAELSAGETEDDELHLSHSQSVDRNWSKQMTANYEDEVAEGGRESSDGDRMMGEG
ncbi:hypothetical protein HPP92_000462 [Vanilla planifolia]|uniref:ENT domain-containing protein n=1 Tax=Vanilla planifolia TaxID=51239 RepID=A0A835RP79_VANPL|nr:hypothetical protein HPP92_000462 [Vanilla planifolia]